MILVDTSVWIEHLRRGEPRLASLLDESAVLAHPFVIGELALGNLQNRQEILGLLRNLPAAKTGTDSEVLTLIEHHQLQGSGIGWIDAHLLAATLLSDASLWTTDRSLAVVAKRLEVDSRL